MQEACDILEIRDREINELQAENKKLKTERDSLRHATGMLNSMVLSGESHSKTSRNIVKDAMTGKKTESPE